MSPERAGRLVRWWVRLYTRGLSSDVARRRLEEIEADLLDHVAYGRAHGVSERHIAFAVASRMIRGVAADASWRSHQAKDHPKEEAMNSRPLSRSAARIAVGVALLLSLPLAVTLLGDGEGWSPADFVLAGVLLTLIGVTVEMALRRAGNLLIALAVAVLGVAAAVLGEADDAPGLVLIGLLFLASALALGVRSAKRSQA